MLLVTTISDGSENHIRVPASIADTILLTHSIFGSNSTTTLVYMDSDGSYIGLAQLRNWKFPGSGWADVENGRYEYISDELTNSATLVVHRDDGGFSERLVFNTPDSGHLSPAFFSRFQIAEASLTDPMVNTSVRGNINPGESLTAGLVVQEGRRFLVRVIGPTLDDFGLKGTESMTAGIWSESREVGILKTVESGDFPSVALQKIETLLGAFPRREGSADLFWFSSLSPGVYTVEAVNTGPGAGNVLIEVYSFPL